MATIMYSVSVCMLLTRYCYNGTLMKGRLMELKNNGVNYNNYEGIKFVSWLSVSFDCWKYDSDM